MIEPRPHTDAEFRTVFRQPAKQASRKLAPTQARPRSRRLLRFSQLITLAVLVAGIAWFFTLRPVVLGGPASYIVVSGVSMEPTYHDGDMVVLRKSSDYALGTIVAYRVPEGDVGAGSLVIHRVIGRDDEGYITQGDNRKGEDLWRPQESDIVGEAWLHMPGFGRLLAKFRSPLPLAIFAGGFTVYFVLTWGKPSKKNGARVERG